MAARAATTSNDLHYFVCCLAEAKQGAGDEHQQEKQSGRGCDLLTAVAVLLLTTAVSQNTTTNGRPCASGLGLKISVLPTGPYGMRSPMAIAQQVYGLVGSWVGTFGSWPVHRRPNCFSTESMLKAFHSSEIFPPLKRYRVITEILNGLPVAGRPIPG